jgi:hypothetical protein
VTAALTLSESPSALQHANHLLSAFKRVIQKMPVLEGLTPKVSDAVAKSLPRNH